MRHGSRIAAAPPGIVTVARWPDPLVPARSSATRNSPPHSVAVVPVAEPVEGDAEHRPGPVVLDQARGDVRVVMLHRPGPQARVERALGRQVLGVEVVGHHLRAALRTAGRGAESPGERTGRRRGARDRRCGGSARPSAPLATDTVFLSSAPTARTWRRAAHGQVQGLGRVAARPAHHLRAAPHRPHHRVVAADVDGAVVRQARRRRAGPGGRRRRRRRGRSGRRRGCRSSSRAGRADPIDNRWCSGVYGEHAAPSSGNPGATPFATGRAVGARRRGRRAGEAT